uniref:Ribosomal protein S3 n=1 Tax=Gracilaria firma TaxID=2510791 RepID=A0A1W6C6X2_9FLOR|nr:ribosomal protein S3 [Gracilaria changii]ARJ60483.1 ribosomal protein S3 [Gracilaria changii]ART65152.1 ribosomal protein S3 [Gracilaria changii]
MTRKTNPIGLRLGLTQVWDFTIQNYCKLNYYYNSWLLKQWQVNNIISKILKSSKFWVNDKEFWYLKNKLFLNIYITKEVSTPYADKYLLLIKELSKIILNWFSFKIYLRIYKRIDWTITSDLVSNYIVYLFEQDRSPSRILWQLCEFLKKNLYAKKVVYSTKGIRLIYLKGFKVKLVGRFDNTKSQMAKSIQQSSGSLSLISLKNQVEFIQKDLYTRLGSCGVQVWLFYEINWYLKNE